MQGILLKFETYIKYQVSQIWLEDGAESVSSQSWEIATEIWWISKCSLPWILLNSCKKHGYQTIAEDPGVKGSPGFSFVTLCSSWNWETLWKRVFGFAEWKWMQPRVVNTYTVIRERLKRLKTSSFSFLRLSSAVLFLFLSFFFVFSRVFFWIFLPKRVRVERETRS